MIATLNVRSQTHNSCEDSIFVTETAQAIYGGVFDGCSTGVKSHWASQTFAYMFSRIGDPTSDHASRTVRRQLSQVAQTLQLDVSKHALSTCMLFMYDKQLNLLRVRVFGDGYYYVNSVEYEIEQNNIPDYFAYHMDDLEAFLVKYPIQTHYDVSSFQICSDGIKSVDISQFIVSDLDPMQLLLHPPTSENYLQRMWNKLHMNHFTISDDLSIISYVKDEQGENP